MKKKSIITSAVILTALSVCSMSYATSQDAEVIELVAVPTPTPVCEQIDRPVGVRHYDLDKDTKDALSRLLWSSPLRSECYKKGLLWVVFNRALDKTGTFSDTIIGNITTTEFTFYDKKAHLSVENEQIVIDTYDDWCSWRDGYHVGSHPSPHALYIRFKGDRNRQLELLDANKQVIEWDPY